MTERPLEVTLVTGMSGAGRSTAARVLEDLGWFVIDNLLPPLLLETLALMASRPEEQRVAIVVDVRSGSFFQSLQQAIADLREAGHDMRILFLEADDHSLVRRFESSRRPHPLRKGRLLEGVAAERELLADLRGEADLVIDTTRLNVNELRRAVEAAFPDEAAVRLRATVMSFGFKYGLPVDADIVADVRFLPNPFWDPELRNLSGLASAVNDFVVEQPEAREFLDRYAGILDMMADGYLREGKRYVTVGIGCTGGKHRSVAMAENLAARLVKSGVETLVVHRDLGRE